MAAGAEFFLTCCDCEPGADCAAELFLPIDPKPASAAPQGFRTRQKTYPHKSISGLDIGHNGKLYQALLLSGAQLTSTRHERMKNLHNIEKSGFRRFEYVGYAAGRVYRVRKHGCGGWEAIERDGVDYQRADTLTALSAKLDKLGNAFFSAPRKPSLPITDTWIDRLARGEK